MKMFFEDDSLIDGANELVFQEDNSLMSPDVSAENVMAKHMTHRRQIEIMRENKLLMLSLKDVYDC